MSHQPAPPPYGQYGGPPPGPLGSNSFFNQLELVGQAACIGGLLMIIFFFLPWSVAPASLDPNTARITPQSYNGFGAASGITEFSSPVTVALYPHLWLIILGAIALITIAVLMSQWRLTARMGAVSILEVSALTLVLELLYLIQVNSFNEGERGVPWCMVFAVHHSAVYPTSYP